MRTSIILGMAGRCGVSPLEGVGCNNVQPRGRLPPPEKKLEILYE